MINYLKNFTKSLKEKSLKYKLLFALVLLLYIFAILSSVITVNVFTNDDYTSTTPGEVNKVNNVIKIDSNYETGDIYTISVYSYRRLSLLQYWLSLLNDDTDISVDYESEYSDEELHIQGTIMKDVSITNSIIVAFVEASKVNPDVSIDYSYEGYIIHTLDPNVKVLKQKDIITHIDGTEFNSKQEFQEFLLLKLKTNTKSINFTIKRDGKLKNVVVDVQQRQEDGNIVRFIGMSGYSYYKINNTSHKYEIENSLTTGPSGGLMQTIAVYNSLTKGDITNGKKIMGTGTIEVDSPDGFGSVGAIGGVEQKIVTADIYEADYVFIPSKNYNDAITQYNKLKNPSYSTPIEAKTFSQVIAELQKLGGK